MNLVLPGAIVTEAIENMAARQGVTMEEQSAKLAEFHAMKRVGQADEVRHVLSHRPAYMWACTRAQAVLPACVVISLRKYTVFFLVSSVARDRQAAYAMIAGLLLSGESYTAICYCRRFASGMLEVSLTLH